MEQEANGHIHTRAHTLRSAFDAIVVVQWEMVKWAEFVNTISHGAISTRWLRSNADATPYFT